MAAVIDDARRAALSADAGPPEPAGYDALMARLAAVEGSFPPVYEQNVVAPFIARLKALGAANFALILQRDPNREGIAALLFDIAQAVLQRGEGYERDATRAFQEVVSDLYDGYLSAADRRGVLPPDKGVLAPLVKWGNPSFGPYTFPVDATVLFDVKAAIVSLPPANARGGLASWSALGHETAGHDILRADTGLQQQLADALRRALAPEGSALADYWADRIDETASDVMGVLNLGPAAGIGLIAYFRGLNAAWGAGPTLRSVGPAEDSHPADLVRGWLVAEVVALLSFGGAKAWSDAIAAETDKDRATIRLAGRTVTPAVARRSARLAAAALVRTPVAALEQHALGDIQGWSDHDERLVDALRLALRTGSALPSGTVDHPVYAAHVLSAATIEAIATGQDVPGLMQRMIAGLNVLHDRNPSWGPLYVMHPGNVARHFMLPPELRAPQSAG